MTQKQLAVISCISIRTLQNYEQNRNGNAPTLHNLLLLADIFDVTPYYLYYGGKKEMQANSLYVDELQTEILKLDEKQLREVHDSEMNGTALPKLSINDEFVNKLITTLNKGEKAPNRGYYRPYIEQTAIRYAQQRQLWKRKFEL